MIIRGSVNGRTDVPVLAFVGHGPSEEASRPSREIESLIDEEEEDESVLPRDGEQLEDEVRDQGSGSNSDLEMTATRSQGGGVGMVSHPHSPE